MPDSEIPKGASVGRPAGAQLGGGAVQQKAPSKPAAKSLEGV